MESIDWGKPLEAGAIADDGEVYKWWAVNWEAKHDCRLLWRVGPRTCTPILLAMTSEPDIAIAVRERGRYRVRNVAPAAAPAKPAEPAVEPYSLATWPVEATRLRGKLWPAGDAALSEWSAIQYVGHDGVVIRIGYGSGSISQIGFDALARDGWQWSATGLTWRPCVVSPAAP